MKRDKYKEVEVEYEEEIERGEEIEIRGVIIDKKEVKFE